MFSNTSKGTKMGVDIKNILSRHVEAVTLLARNEMSCKYRYKWVYMYCRKFCKGGQKNGYMA